MPNNIELGASLVKKARDMIPMLRAETDKVRSQGQVAPETIQAFKDAGFFKVLQPARYGGFELPPNVYLGIADALAEGCMASAWVYGVLAVHNWQLALFDDRAPRDVWKDDDNVLISSSYMPVGKVTRVEGGFRISGRWNFSSGCAHAQWVILGSNAPAADGKSPPEPLCFLLPRSDYQILQNWDVMGLQGTGSNDILVEDAFVPDYRTIGDQAMFDLNCPGHAVNKDPLYKIPFAQLFNRTVSCTSVGVLRNALNNFVDGMKQKRATYTGSRLAQDTTIQFAVADVERILREQTLVRDHEAARIYELAQTGAWTIEERASLGASATQMVARCVEGIDILMTFAGAKAVFRGNVIQNAFLDLHTARAHVANNPYTYGRNLGAIRFGLENGTLDI